MTTPLSWRANPVRITDPSVPPPSRAASVAVATTCTAAVRMPVIISGTARGSSARSTTWRSSMPIARADSTTSRSTSRKPT